MRHLLKYTLLLLVVGFSSCASVSEGPGGATQSPPPGILRMHQAAESVVMIKTEFSGGSAVAMLRYEGKTYLATARHVVDQAGLGASVEMMWYDEGRKFGTATVLMIHPTEDMAVLVSNDEVDTIGYDETDYQPPRSVVAIGHPRGVFPANISIGWLVRGHRGMFSYNAPSWFGNSGGALLDFTTGHVIGIVVHLHGDEFGPLSNRCCAIPITNYIKFARETIAVRSGR